MEDGVMDMVSGRRYRITHQSDTQKYARVSVLDFMQSGTGTDASALMFSARPIAGTQAMPRSWIINIEEVSSNTPITMNQRS
jgi:hypothetical protein